MEDLSKYTPIELNKMINDTKVKHDALKLEIINDTIELDKLLVMINGKTNNLTELEKNYIALIEEINKR
jgi:hypothetical protein